MEDKIQKIIEDLSSNYREDKEVLQDIFKEVSSIASDISNRKKEDEKLYPYIKKATKAIYLIRGAEGITSSSEGGVTNSYDDIIEELRNNIIKNGLRRLQ